MAAWLAPAIGAGASLLGSGMNSIFGGNQARKTRKANMRLAKWQHSQDVDMWNKANAYNDPSQQMARLRKAGLNPNLVYGNGSVTGNTSTQTPKQSVPDASARPSLDVDLPNPMQMIGMYQDYKNKQVQHDNLSAQTKLMEQESELKQLMMAKTIASTGKTSEETRQLRGLYDGKLSQIDLNLNRQQLQNNMLNKDWENYKKYSIRPQDSIIYRGGAKMFEEAKSFFNQFRNQKPNIPWKKSKN